MLMYNNVLFTHAMYLRNKILFKLRIMSISFASLKHLNLPISIKIPVTISANCLYLHDSYITKFNFMNIAFAKLVLACLYIYVSCLLPKKNHYFSSELQIWIIYLGRMEIGSAYLIHIKQ